MPAEIDKLKADIQKAPDPATKARLESNLAQAESYLEGARGDEAGAADAHGVDATTR